VSSIHQINKTPDSNGESKEGRDHT